MVELSKKFSEYVLMYKTLSKQIKTLEQRKETVEKNEKEEIEAKIQRYESEVIKIKKMFPDNFFEELN